MGLLKRNAVALIANKRRLTRRGSIAVLPALLLGLATDTGCYDTGDGSAPPLDAFYFPVGLKVSNGGTVLYAVNSNFDLQFNGGTLQSYDLRLIRQHALLAVRDPASPELPLIRRGTPAACPSNPPIFREGESGRQPLGETCAPPVSSTFYFRDSAVIGAFATELLLSAPPSELIPQQSKVHADDPLPPPATTTVDRLFVPVRGDATLTWAAIARDSFAAAPDRNATKAEYAPFRIDCGQDPSNRCDRLHQVGEDPGETGNTRHITLPGEPFGAALSEDGSWIVVTHQNETKTTLFSTGLGRERSDADATVPAIEFVVDRVPFGGIGIAPVPHDPDAFLASLGAPALPRPAFLQTSRAIPEISLIRQYSDEQGGVGPAIRRPFLDVEAAFPISASAGGTDSRGIVIDPTPRLACKARVPALLPGELPAARDQAIAACARKPARAFIANRSPASLLVGDVGVAQGIDGAYDPDRLTIHTSVPLSAGPSRVYLAPIVDRDGAYALRVFIVCFDSATIFIYDPDAGVLENVLRVGIGPFAMAFDPFSLEDVAKHATVPIDDRDKDIGLRRYRFAYLASFTQSYVQLIDLDNAVPNPVTFEHVVYTLGRPTNPKGT
jgi:hypothetical protein